MSSASVELAPKPLPSRKYTLAKTSTDTELIVPGTAINAAVSFERRRLQREHDMDLLEKSQAVQRVSNGSLAGIVSKRLVGARRRRNQQLSPIKTLQGILAERKSRLEMGRAYTQMSAPGKTKLPQIDGAVLFKEVKQDHVVVAKQMLLSSSDEEGQISRAYDAIGNSSLHIASRSGNVSMVRVLLMFGAETNIQNNVGQTPMLLAWTSWEHLSIASMFRPAQMCSVESIIELLMQYGADPNLSDAVRGESAMHLAAHFGHPKIVQRLIKFGGDHERRSAGKDGATALAIAEKIGEDSPSHMECAKLMKNWRLIRRELKHVEVRSHCQRFLNDPSMSPQRTKAHNAIAFDMAASDLALFAGQSAQRTRGLRLHDGTHGGLHNQDGSFRAPHIHVSPIKKSAQNKSFLSPIRASAKRHQLHLSKLKGRHASAMRPGQKFNPKRRLGALKRRARVATEVMSDIHHPGGANRPAVTSPISHRSPSNISWGRVSTKNLQKRMSTRAKSKEFSSTNVENDQDDVHEDDVTVQKQRFLFNDVWALPIAKGSDSPTVQLWWNRNKAKGKDAAESDSLGSGANKRGSANSVKRMYFDLSQLSAPWSPPGGHRGSSFRPKQTIFESSTACASTRF